MGASSREPDTDETTDLFAEGLWWDDAAWRLGWGSLYSTWAHADDAKALGRVDWGKCPPSADPVNQEERWTFSFYRVSTVNCHDSVQSSVI